MILWILGAAIIVALLLSGAVRSVNLNELGVVYTLGRHSRTAPPGLTLLVPFVQTLKRVDAGVRNASTELESVQTADGRSVRVQLFVGYQVADAAKYAGNLAGARDTAYSKSVIEMALTKLIERATSEQLARLSADELGRQEERIASELTDIAGDEAAKWGIGIVRVDFYAELEAPSWGTYRPG